MYSFPHGMGFSFAIGLFHWVCAPLIVHSVDYSECVSKYMYISSNVNGDCRVRSKWNEASHKWQRYFHSYIHRYKTHIHHIIYGMEILVDFVFCATIKTFQNHQISANNREWERERGTETWMVSEQRNKSRRHTYHKHTCCRTSFAFICWLSLTRFKHTQTHNINASIRWQDMESLRHTERKRK